MHHTKHYLLTATALALTHWAAPAWAGTTEPANGVEEIPDAELGDMRGRYVAGDNTVAWFGVKMISTWRSDTGQLLQGALALSMDFRASGTRPVIRFEPSVTITGAGTPPPAHAGARGVDDSGLANISGVRQSVQVAGDGNQVGNVTRLTISDDDQAAATTAAENPALTASAAARQGDASALASFDGHGARVLLTIEGQGAVEQWIRSGSVGQSVQITSDNQWIGNLMDIEMVRGRVSTSLPLTQSVAQAIYLARGIGAPNFR
ncbi:MAG: hypothetical protein ACTHJO_03640 [Rhodanobacter sp.]